MTRAVSKIFSLHDIILGSALSLVRQEVFDHKEYNNSSVISNAGNETGSLLYLLYLFVCCNYCVIMDMLSKRTTKKGRRVNVKEYFFLNKNRNSNIDIRDRCRAKEHSLYIPGLILS